MQPVSIPGTDLRVSRLCYGNMTFGGQTAEPEAARILDRVLAGGINFIDTANVYNKGAAEEYLGKLLGARRKNVVLASKVRGSMGPGSDESGLSKAAMLRAVDDSLRRLRTDYLDIYYLHQPDANTPIEETLETMDAIVRSGKVRYPAISNYAAWQAAQCRAIAAANGYRPIHIAQMMHNLIARGLEQEFVPFAKAYDVAIVAYNPLAGGLLTGKQNPEAPLAGTRFDNNQMYLDRYWHPDFFKAVDRLATIAKQAGRSLVSLSLNWLLHHTTTASVILGASRLDQLQENLAACEDGPLDPEVVKQCDTVWASLRGVTPKYNR
ncbi:MAG: aldo/keto reductase [Bryobacteraceae bacterium]